MQLVVQITEADAYPEWKAGWTKAWRRQGGKWTTSEWPETLAPDTYAALLLPLPAGRVGLAAGKQPRVTATPILTTGGAPANGTCDDMALGLIAHWIANPGDGQSARLAPPVIEFVGRQGVVERRVQSLGLGWPLPLADGV